MLYGRQSETNEESISLELQDAANRAHCDREGYDVVVGLADPGISGRRWANRPDAVEAVRMIADREADLIVTWKWSRISRRRLDFEVALDRVESAGGRIESSTEPIDTTTASGRFHRGVLADVAQFESERIGEGWKETHANRRARGLPAQGGDRYGYRRVQVADAQTGKLYTVGYEVDESQAEALRLAYTRFIEGRGANRIVRELNALGYRNRLGAPFKRPQLYDLLDSGFAAGLIVHRQRDPAGRVVGDPEYHPGVHEPIIDEHVWTAYLAARRVRAGQPSAQVGSTHPLGGLMRCGDCGAHMTAYSTPGPDNRNGTPPTYACNRWRSLGSEWVRCVTVSRPRVERIVREWLAEIAGDVESAAAADRRMQRRQRQARTDAEKAAATVANVNRQLAELELSSLRGRAPEAYRQAQDALLEELDRAQAASEEAALAALRETPALQSAAQYLADRWDLRPGDATRAGLVKIIRGVWVYPPPSRGYPSTLHIVPLWEPAPEIERPDLPDEPLDRQ